MNAKLLCFLFLLFILFSCKKKDKLRTISPSISWLYDGNNYTATALYIDYNAQFGGYYETVGVFEDTTQILTLSIGLTNGQAVGSHTVTAYWVNLTKEEKANPNVEHIVFQVYSINVTDYNGYFVSGTFSANNASGPILSGNFTDINSVP